MAPPVRPSCFTVTGSSSSAKSQLLPSPAPSTAATRSRGTGQRAAAGGTFHGGSAAVAATEDRSSCDARGAPGELGQQASRMEDKDKSDGWDEDLEEADELVCVHKDPVSTSFLASGISRRNKSEKKPRFSIHGHGYDVKTEILHIGGHEDTSGVPSTKLSQTIHTKKANTESKFDTRVLHFQSFWKVYRVEVVLL